MTPTYAWRDSMAMLRRQLLHVKRYPSLTIMLLGQPILFLLLFVYVFGATLGAGLPSSEAAGLGSRADYLVYITPGILIMTVASVAMGTAIAVATDMSGGIIARFRTMAIARASVLTGHVVGALMKTAVALFVVLSVAFILGFRSHAGVLDWVGAYALLLLVGLALTWLTVGLGLAADSVETASNTPMFLMILPFVSSGFVPTEAMPWGLRHVAENQPFTPIIGSVRALVTGADVGRELWLAVGWCLAISLATYLWSRRLYQRVPVK
jgi:ABC-2 type transport system permease protein